MAESSDFRDVRSVKTIPVVFPIVRISNSRCVFVFFVLLQNLSVTGGGLVGRKRRWGLGLVIGVARILTRCCCCFPDPCTGCCRRCSRCRAAARRICPRTSRCLACGHGMVCTAGCRREKGHVAILSTQTLC